MERMKKILERIYNTMMEQKGDKHVLKKIVKLSRKKYEIAIYNRFGSNKNVLKLSNSTDGYIEYQEDFFYVQGSNMDNLLIVLESLSDKELKSALDAEIIKFSQKEMDSMLAKEADKFKKFEENLFQLISNFKEMHMSGKTLKAKIGENSYKVSYNVYNWVGRDYTFQIQSSNATRLKVSDGECEMKNYLIYEEAVRVLSRLSYETLEEWLEEEDMVFGPRTIIKESFTVRFKRLLEKRNDYKILFQFFEDEKYERHVRRIEKYIGQLVR